VTIALWICAAVPSLSLMPLLLVSLARWPPPMSVRFEITGVVVGSASNLTLWLDHSNP
jgi:hypothetical protein